MGNASGRDVGLLVLRTAMGGILFVHGAQKLFGWFGGGIAGTGRWRRSASGAGGQRGRGRPGTAGGGALLALGLATPAAGAAVTGTMAVAAEMHVPGGFFAHEGGVEYVAFLGVAAAAVAITGSGELSVDALLGHRLNRPWMRNLALAAAAPAAAFVIRRRQALAATQAGRAGPHGPAGRRSRARRCLRSWWPAPGSAVRPTCTRCAGPGSTSSRWWAGRRADGGAGGPGRHPAAVHLADGRAGAHRRRRGGGGDAA